ncbi:hypothetical protein K9L67_01620 [Candidatus Woesearchaeota archaeon]|nr:hypothetical protein [Candidatus Woesearchaeota archaeon]MCF7900902.1 hypothetical protein [Candidatus Woesearchaeota archaeon]MCF8013049.1 hypothetical protein [Candidatus Woesearchaeota archaeon]
MNMKLGEKISATKKAAFETYSKIKEYRERKKIVSKIKKQEKNKKNEIKEENKKQKNNNKMVQQNNNIPNKRDKHHIDSSHLGGINALYMTAILVHILDWLLFSFRISPGTIVSRVVAYIALAIGAHFVLRNESWTDSIKEFWPLVIIPTFIIPLVGEFAKMFTYSARYADTIAAFAFAIPIWLLYLNSITRDVPAKEQTIFMKIGKRYILILAIFAIINLSIVTTMSIAEFDALGTTGMDIGIATNTLWEFITGTVDTLGSSINESINRVYENSIGVWYKGRVEEGKENSGLYIKDFRTFGEKTKYYKGDTIELIADIEAKQLEKETLIDTKCYIEELGISGYKQKQELQGTIEIAGKPINSLIRFDDVISSETILCVVDSELLKTGRYQAKLVGTLNFTTEGTVQYILLSREDIQALSKSQRDNINGYLNIPIKPWAEYTQGPLSLKMSSENHKNPVLVSRESPTSSINTIGFLLSTESMNTNSRNGIIKRIKEVRIEVPPEFDLDCSTGEFLGQTIRQQTGYKIYKYNYPSQKYYDLHELPQVCRATINSANVNKLLTGPITPTEIYVFASVDYEYEFIRRSQSFNVLEANS